MITSNSTADEQVVLLDDAGHAIGTADKATVHTAHTPLHLAFSLYGFDDDGRFLLTRRALDKATFPGVWTNSACGHPAPGESLADAASRRARSELGLTVSDVRVVLADFGYRAEMGGVVENELCPVLVGRLIGVAAPDPSEVADTEWVQWRQFASDVLTGRRQVSPWSRTQVARLDDLGPDPLAWPSADTALLPPAAQRL